MTRDQLNVAYANAIADLAISPLIAEGGSLALNHYNRGEIVGKVLGGRNAVSKNSSRAAYAARLKQRAAKQAAKELFEQWQAGKKMFVSGAAFARHVVDCSHGVLTNPRVVERWVTGWRRELSGRHTH